MEFLVKVATYHAWLMSNEESRNTIVEKSTDFFKTFPEDIRGVPLYIAMMAPQIMGGMTASAALLIATEITDPETLKGFKSISLKDLVAAVQLHQETGTPLTEIVQEMKLISAK